MSRTAKDKWTEAEYLEMGGVVCRCCGSSDIEGGNVECNVGGAYQQITCNGCGASWMDCYTLTHTTDYERGDV